MNTILVWKEQLQNIYAKYSLYIDIALKFILSMLVFGLINTRIGFMEAASGWECTLGLSVICAFMPMTIMLIAATALVLLHFYSVSIGIVGLVAAMFLLLYIFLLRFTSNKAWLVLLTAVAFALKVPLVIPVAIGLLATPMGMIPVICGGVAYYIIYYVKTSSSTFKVEEVSELIEVILTAVKQIVGNKEMWIMIAAIAISILLIYGIRTRFFDHAWKIASVVGAVVMIVICTAGNIIMDLHISYPEVILNAVVAIAAGLLLEVIFFGVDYTRTEQLEFEDDEYHYYVKAVPKYAVTAPEKSVKQIVKPESTYQPDQSQDAEEILLTRSLSKELGLENQNNE